jgi:transposase
MRAAALEDYRARPRKVLLPGLRGDYRGAGAPHPIPRGFAGPGLPTMVLVNKFLLHQTLNRQSKTYARERIEIDVSTRIGSAPAWWRSIQL